ncbi:MAG: DivIVA domain-containing protein [Fimbriimonas sp.]
MDRVMPIDLEHPDLRRRIRGYDVRAVDALLRGAARSLHELRMENEALRERLAGQTEEVERVRSQERMMSDALVTAQRAADETRAAAQKHADAILEEARLAALAERVSGQQAISEIRFDMERLRAERARMEGEIRALLDRMLRELGPTNTTLAVVEAPTLTIVDGVADAAHG